MRGASLSAKLGSSVTKPPRWGDRLLHSKSPELAIPTDVEHVDYPAVKKAFRKDFHGENEPLAIGVSDLAELVAAKPGGAVTKLFEQPVRLAGGRRRSALRHHLLYIP